MISNLLDKIIFGALLIFFFQVPILSDHYLQFISGYYQATELQVNNFKKNAALHGYQDVYAMVEDFMKNNNAAVSKDGEQKLQTLREYEALKEALAILQSGNIFQRSWYMFHPSRWQVLENVLENFSPGIPLKISDVLYSIVLALLLSFLFMWPVNYSVRKINIRDKKLHA